MKRIILTGAHGFIGKALKGFLESRGYQVEALRSRSTGKATMNEATGWIDRDFLENAFAVIHLAGEPIAQRWTAKTKNQILESRRQCTRLLAETLARLQNPPSVFVSMSGINRYGYHRPNETLTETSPTSTAGFLGEVSSAWEDSTQPANQSGIRTVNLRTGVVLAASGGALKTMLPAFRLGLGGRIGSGKQMMSWIRLGDLVRLIGWIVETPQCQGPINAVSPQPVTQFKFAQILAKTLHRPSFCPTPSWAVKLALGQMAEETLLADLAVLPEAATANGFGFETPSIESALPRALQE